MDPSQWALTSLIGMLVLASSASADSPFGPDKNGLGRRPPMGWSSWCTGSSCHQEGPVCHGKNCTKTGLGALHDVCNEEMIQSVATEMLQNGMHAAGYTWINLDDCWENVTRTANGSMAADSSRFPSGTLKELADWLHARNFSFGMYTSAGVQTCSTGQRTIPGRPDARGVPGSCSDVPEDKISGVTCLPSYQRDADTFASWGVDYIKLDWCSPFETRAELTGAFFRAVNSTGRPMWLNFHCDGAYADWCAAYGNSWRAGMDHHDAWSNTEQVIENLADAASTSGPFRWADPDFLMTGGAGCDGGQKALMEPGVRCPGQTDIEYKTEVTLWVVSSAPLLVATDVRSMSALQKRLLLNPEVIAVNQADGTNHGRVVGAGTSKQVWAKSMSNGCITVALYNSGSSSADISVQFSDLPRNSRDSFHVRDLWARKDLGSFMMSYTAMNVETHGTVLLQLCYDY